MNQHPKRLLLENICICMEGLVTTAQLHAMICGDMKSHMALKDSTLHQHQQIPGGTEETTGPWCNKKIREVGYWLKFLATPRERWKHTKISDYTLENLYLFGGIQSVSGSVDAYMNDMWKYYSQAQKWELVIPFGINSITRRVISSFSLNFFFYVLI